MIKNKKSGFTLVEVLTVIMIIGILATVVLVSLDAARRRARDSAVQNQLRQIASLAEAVYTMENGYEEFSDLSTAGSDHPSADDYRKAVDKINDVSDSDNHAGGGDDNIQIHFSTDNKDYCAFSNLVRRDEEVFCVDSSGDARITDDNACAADNISCTDSADPII